VLWFANNDQPAAGLWQRYVITTNCPRAYDVVLLDLNGDGNPLDDILQMAGKLIR
jgi:hypothetical protein